MKEKGCYLFIIRVALVGLFPCLHVFNHSDIRKSHFMCVLCITTIRIATIRIATICILLYRYMHACKQLTVFY